MFQLLFHFLFKRWWSVQYTELAQSFLKEQHFLIVIDFLSWLYLTFSMFVGIYPASSFNNLKIIPQSQKGFSFGWKDYINLQNNLASSSE